MTPLHLATVAGNQACVQALENAGASMVVRSSAAFVLDAGILPAGSTPMHIAAQRGDAIIVHNLLQVCLSCRCHCNLVTCALQALSSICMVAQD